jgi:hypothetical protein
MDPRGDPHAILDGLPFGTGRCYQNFGGNFDLKACPEFLVSIKEAWQCLEERGRPKLFVIAKHYSKSNNQGFGCAGNQFNRQTAESAARGLKAQFDAVFAGDPETHTICVLVDTDEDGITFLGERVGEFDIATVASDELGNVSSELKLLYPLMSEQMFRDLLDLALRNLRHVAQVRLQPRTASDLLHNESMLFIGQSSEAICPPGEAFVISPFDSNLPRAIKSAGEMLWENHSRRGSKQSHITLIVSAPYHPIANARSGATEVLKTIAKLRVQNLSALAVDTLHKRIPRLIPYMKYLNVIISMDTLLVEPFE